MKSFSFEEFQQTRKAVEDLKPWMLKWAGEPGFLYEDQIAVKRFDFNTTTKDGRRVLQPAYMAIVGPETYVCDRLDKVEAWLWEEITGFTCPLNEPRWTQGIEWGEHPVDKYACTVMVGHLVPEQVELMANDIGIFDGFGEDLWLNFTAIRKLLPHEGYVWFGRETALYNYRDTFQLLRMVPYKPAVGGLQVRPKVLACKNDTFKESRDG
jgi:hypothetical protein